MQVILGLFTWKSTSRLREDLRWRCWLVLRCSQRVPMQDLGSKEML